MMSVRGGRRSAQEAGQGLVEYALILVLVAIVVIAILLLMGPVVGNVFSNIVMNLEVAGLITDKSGVITSVSVQHSGSALNVTINVSTDTNVDVSASPSGRSESDVPCNNGGCFVSLGNVGFGAGSVTVTAAVGGTVTVTYPASNP